MYACVYISLVVIVGEKKKKNPCGYSSTHCFRYELLNCLAWYFLSTGRGPDTFCNSDGRRWFVCEWSRIFVVHKEEER